MTGSDCKNSMGKAPSSDILHACRTQVSVQACRSLADQEEQLAADPAKLADCKVEGARVDKQALEYASNLLKNGKDIRDSFLFKPEVQIPVRRFPSTPLLFLVKNSAF